MHVSRVTVNGVRANFHRSGPELVVHPRSGILRGSRFVTAVTSPIVFGSSYGWIYTKDGAFVGNEPNAAQTWYPCNDYPTKKASLTFRVTVPKGTSVVANGRLVSQRTRHGMSRFLWSESRPMATYLSTIDIGKWKYLRGRTPAGIPEAVAIQ